MHIPDTGSLCVLGIWKPTRSINPMFLDHVVVCVDQFQGTDWKALEQPLLSFKEYIQASLKILSGECLLQICPPMQIAFHLGPGIMEGIKDSLV